MSDKKNQNDRPPRKEYPKDEVRIGKFLSFGLIRKAISILKEQGKLKILCGIPHYRNMHELIHEIVDSFKAEGLSVQEFSEHKTEQKEGRRMRGVEYVLMQGDWKKPG